MFNATPEEVAEHFELSHAPDLAPRYNVSPTQLVPVVALRADGVSRFVALVRWGFVWEGASDPKPGPVNARCETVARLPMFAEAFREHRCIVASSGFYEFTGKPGKKIPHRFRLKGGGLLGFAGIWPVWRSSPDDPNPLLTCAIITTTPNELVKTYHDRMPAVLNPAYYGRWLDEETPAGALKELLRPYPAELMEALPASPLVNNPRNEGPSLLDPAA